MNDGKLMACSETNTENVQIVTDNYNIINQLSTNDATHGNQGNTCIKIEKIESAEVLLKVIDSTTCVEKDNTENELLEGANIPIIKMDVESIESSSFVQRKLDADEKHYLCVVCDKKLVSSSKLTSHMRIHTKERPFPCQFCDKRFRQKGDLLRHNSAIHLKEKPFSCDVCEEVFAHKCNLMQHVKTVHLKEKPFFCELCGKRFGSKGTLTKHKNVHQKVFECEQCRGTFSSQKELKKHVRRCGMPYCDNCNKNFKTKLSLNKHLSHCSYCLVCTQKFDNYSTFLDHRKTHINDKCFPCAVCSKVLFTYTDLIKHNNSWHVG